MADIILGQHPLLKKQLVDKRIRDLIGHQFVADQLFTQTNVNALAISYMQDADQDENGRQAYDDVPETGEASNFERIGLDEVKKSEMIRKYGLEAVISGDMQKWGSEGQFDRAFRKLAVNIKKMVDEMAYETATNKYTVGNGILGKTKSTGYWNDATNGAENIIADLVDAKSASRKFGYSLDTVVMNPEQEAQFLKNKSIRDAFRQNNTDIALLRGYIGDFLGLSFIVDENFQEDNVVLVQKKIIGDIADAEGLSTHIYNEDSNDRSIVRATRYSKAYLTAPKASYLIKNLNA